MTTCHRLAISLVILYGLTNDMKHIDMLKKGERIMTILAGIGWAIAYVVGLAAAAGVSAGIGAALS